MAESKIKIGAFKTPEPAEPGVDVPTSTGAVAPGLPTDILGLFDLIAGASPAATRRFKTPMWQAWKVLLAATFGLPAPTEFTYPGAPVTPGTADVVLPTEAEIAQLTGEGATAADINAEIYRRCTGRATWPTEQASELWMMVGRRGGKSQIAAIISIFLACCRDYSEELSPGETALVMIVAPKREQTRVIFNYIKAIMRMVPELNALVADYRKTDIELTNGIRIEPQTASKATSRGYTIVGLVCDEIAFWRTADDSATADKDVLEALTPSMATISNSMLVSLSSPYARRGELYRNSLDHYGRDGDPVLVWRADTVSMHPRLKIAMERAKAYEKDDIAARSEFGALFRSDLQALFSKEALKDVTVDGRYELPYVQGVTYRGFVDPSGGSSDSMTLAIAHTNKTEGKEVLDLVREIRPPFSTEGVTTEFALLLKSYRVSQVTGDAYSGQWVRQEFQKNGILYEVSKLNRSQIYLEALPLVNSKGVELLDPHGSKELKHLHNQFETLERRPGRGKDVVDHPPGGHDDVANAAAGALVAPDSGSELRVRRL